MKTKGLFDRNTDMGFLLTTDGVQVFKAKTRFSIWPIALECLNLPPTIRAKRQNMLCTGSIPGPKSPKNLDSFLYPLIKEFEVLQMGIPAVLNSSLSDILPKRDREFVLKGHICLVGADMVAREKVVGSYTVIPHITFVVDIYTKVALWQIGYESDWQSFILLL